MMRAIQKHLRDFLAIIAIAVVAVLVGGYILSNQRFYAPSWVPIVGSDFVDYQAEMATAQAFTAGQGQTVMIAGVSVGEIGEVTLNGGRARITMKVKRKYTPIYRDATILSRPKTGLNDMTIELDPGNASAGELPGGGVIPISQTLPNVNPDEFLAGLDVETRNYVQLLVGGAGQGLDGNAANLSATLKRFDPLARNTAKLTSLLSRRTRYIKRSIRNFRLLSEELGSRDTQLGQFVDSSNRGLPVLRQHRAGPARDDPRAALRPSRPRTRPLKDSEELTDVLGPTLEELQPTAEGLAPALQAFQSFAKETKPVIEDQIGPFTRDRPAAGGRAAPGRRRLRRHASRSSRRASTCSTTSSTGWPTTRRASRRATSTGSPGPTTWPRRCSPRRTAWARPAAAWSSAPATRCASTRRSARRTRSSARS